MRTLVKIAAAGTAAIALIAVPVGVSAAAAPSSVAGDRSDSSVSLTDQQRTAVIAARKAYIESATQVMGTYRKAVSTALESAKTQVEDEALALALAKDAYRVTEWSGGDTTAAKAALQQALDAYKSAWASAKSGVQGQLDAAKGTAKTGLDAAKATYQSAITAAFAGSTVPPALQNPPGGWSKGGWGMGGKGMGDRGMGLGDRGMGMGMGR